MQPIAFPWDTIFTQGPKIFAWASFWKPFFISRHQKVQSSKLTSAFLSQGLNCLPWKICSLFHSPFSILCTYCFLLWFVQDQALDCNAEQHLAGISYTVSVLSLNWSQPGISTSSIPSLLFMCLVSTKPVPAHILDGGCAEVLLLMEIHYSKIDNTIPLIREVFPCKCDHASLLHTLLEHTKHNTGKKNNPLPLRFVAICWQFWCAALLLLITSASSSS